jgi:hypothetical protein
MCVTVNHTVPRTLRVLLLVAGISVIGLLIRQTGPRVIWTMLLRVGWRVPVVAGIYAMYLGTRALALWRAAPAGVVRLRDALRVRVSGDVIEALTFTGPIFAEPAKGWFLMQYGLTATDAFATVVVEFVLYDVATSVLEIAALSLLLAGGALPEAVRTGAMVLLVIPIAFLAACAWAAITGVGVIVPILRWSRVVVGASAAGWATDKVAPIERVLVDVLHVHHRRCAEVVAIETAAHLLLILEVWVVLRALGFSGALHALIIEGGAKLIGLVFAFVPGQVGAAESVYVFLARAVGVPAAAGLTLALVRRVRGLLIGAIGVSVLTLFRDSSATR